MRLRAGSCLKEKGVGWKDVVVVVVESGALQVQG
jgi:hypothetical protein